MIFTPLQFKNLTIKNRVFRSNISGRFDNYDGSGNQARINWEVKFAKGGVGAILSSFVPVQMRGRILPNYATIDRDANIPFWRELGKRVHEHDAKFIMQLSHGGRQRDIGGIEHPKGLSSTSTPDPLHGFEAEAMTVAQIRETVQAFAEGARRAREAGLDGVELHASNGYLFTQFLSSAINDRTDEYNGRIEDRAKFLLDVVHAIRAKVGADFHLQVKISTTESCNAMNFGEPHGNTIEDSVKVCRLLEAAGVDALHVSHGGYFPHPRNPAGDLPVEDFVKVYDAMVSSGTKTYRNYRLLRNKLTGAAFRRQWLKARGKVIEGCNLADAEAVKRAVSIPVVCTGGFQHASAVEAALAAGQCDAVSIARGLVANNDLVNQWRSGADAPAKPCSYCNRCLINAIENPLGCYDVDRFDGDRDAMVREIMTVFQPAPTFS